MYIAVQDLGDQIGRIFAKWVLVSSVQFFDNPDK
jgi:hypothetical protein